MFTGPTHLGAAVSMMQTGQESIKGLIRFVQTDEEKCVVEGTVDGLPPGHHAICVHECGDISDGCERYSDITQQTLYNTIRCSTVLDLRWFKWTPNGHFSI